MDIKELLIKIGDKILVAVTTVIAAVLLIYSGYVLYDTFYVGQNAFSSYDMQQYKPVQKEDGEISFEELFQINEDAVGWLYINGTNIDYPVVQGENNLEYAGKDLYGNSSLTGCIYLASENDSSFVDAYNIIYGHHMDNGAMFGDVEKFADKEFFDTHREGVIQTPSGNWDLRTVCSVRTNAYESMVYSIGSYEKEELLDYFITNAVQIDRNFDFEGIEKIVLLSTCADAETNGRDVLVCSATKRVLPVVTAAEQRKQEEEKASQQIRHAIGHWTDSEHWAFLNLVCVIVTVFILIPLGSIRRKYRQIGFSRNVADEISKEESSGFWRSLLRKEEREEQAEKLIRCLRSFLVKMLVGMALEIIVVIVAVRTFLNTEDLTKTMIIEDEHTPMMIGIAAIALLIDFICFRYRGVKLPDTSEAEET